MFLVGTVVQSCELKKKSFFRDPFNYSQRQIGWVCRTTWSAFLIESSCGAGHIWRPNFWRAFFFGDVAVLVAEKQVQRICGNFGENNWRKCFRFLLQFSQCFPLFSAHPAFRATFPSNRRSRMESVLQDIPRKLSGFMSQPWCALIDDLQRLTITIPNSNHDCSIARMPLKFRPDEGAISAMMPIMILF